MGTVQIENTPPTIREEEEVQMGPEPTAEPNQKHPRVMGPETVAVPIGSD
jgi:hypothetical protein